MGADINPVFGASLAAASIVHASTPLDAVLFRRSDAPTSETLTLENFEKALWRDLHADPRLVPSRFPVDSPPIFRMLDSEFRTQVLAEAIRYAKAEIVAKCEAGHASPNLDDARRSAFDMAYDLRHKLFELWTIAKDKALLVSFGTANDKVWNPVLERFLNQLAEKAVENGVSNANGGARVGLMGRASEAWKREIKNWNSKHPDDKTAADLILLLLWFHNENNPEPPAEGLSKSSTSHPLATFMTRTRLMFAVAPGAVNTLFPGGLGTLEEGGAIESDKKVGTRVVRDSASKNVHVAYVNTTFDVVDPRDSKAKGISFYDGLKRLHRRMEDEGAEKSTVLSGIEFYEPGLSEEDDAALVDAIIESCVAGKTSRAPSMDPFEAELRRQVTQRLDTHRTFNMPVFEPDSDPYLPFLDGQYLGQVRLETENLALGLVSKSLATPKLDVGFEQAVDAAVERAVHLRGQLRRLTDRCKGNPTIVVSGTSREDVLANDSDMAGLARELVAKAVAEGKSIVFNGDGRTGLGRIIGEFWAQEMSLHPQSASQFIRLQLRIENDMTAGRTWDTDGRALTEEQALAKTRASEKVFKEILGPPMSSPLVRSHAALCLGNVEEVVVFPGDCVTLSFASETLLARQLADKTLTPFTSKELPRVKFINSTFGKTEGFYEGLREQLEAFVLCETARAKHFDGVSFVDRARVERVFDDPRS
jgi:hypothetical protein